MKPTVKTALIFVAIYIAIKILIFKSDLQHDESWSMAGTYANMLFILLSSFIGLSWYKKTDKYAKSSFGADLKIAMQGALVYTILVGSFTYVYYNNIDTEFTQVKIDNYMAGMNSFEITEEDRILFPPEFTDAQIKEDIIERERESAEERMFTPGSISGITTVGLFILGAIYALIVTLVYRKFFTPTRPGPRS